MALRALRFLPAAATPALRGAPCVVLGERKRAAGAISKETWGRWMRRALGLTVPGRRTRSKPLASRGG
eukprot:1767715-Pyramimonas_sp.AAC.1